MGGGGLTDRALLDLLDLQAIDTEIDQFLHARESLPELAAYKTAHESVSELKVTVAAQTLSFGETTSKLSKAEGELELTEKKRGTEEMRMFAGGLSAKDLENLQREVEMFGRQIETAEEEILALLETSDQEDAALAETTGQLDELEAESAGLETVISEEWKRIDEEVAVREERRGDFLPLIPPELLRLYEKLRPLKEGVGVARLVEGVCGGCHLSLSPAEQVEVLKEEPPRCLRCRRILVPQ